MEIKVIEHELISNFTRDFISAGLIKYNPIIAGGFAVWVYNMISKYENREDSEFEYTPEQFYKHNITNILDNIREISFPFGDIDVYFKRGNRIFDDVILMNPDTKSHHPDAISKRFKMLFKSSCKTIKISKYANTFIVNHYNGTNIEYFIDLICSIFYSSSGRVPSKGYALKTQLVKRVIESIDDLFSGFDLINCQAAIYDNKLYISQDAINAFENKLLCSNAAEVQRRKDLAGTQDIMIDRLLSTHRAFKYGQRYNLDWDSDLIEEVFNIYVDMFSREEEPEFSVLYSHLDYPNRYLSAIDEPPIELSDYGYSGKEPRSIVSEMDAEAVSWLSKRLLEKFSLFIRMKNYDPTYNAFFVGCGISFVEKSIEEYYYK